MGISATYVSATSFQVTTDKTSIFNAGRRVRANCGADGYKEGTVESSAYSAPNTTVTLTGASDDLTSNLTEVEVGLVKAGPAGNLPGNLSPKLALTKTDDYSVSFPDDADATLRMNAASAKTFTLPSVGEDDDGKRLTLANVGSADCYVVPSDSDTFGRFGQKLVLDPDDSVTLEYYHGDTQWLIVGGEAFAPVIGIEFDIGSDAWQHIDVDGNAVTWEQSDFDNHPAWGGITRVNLAADGTENAEYGDAGYANDGTNGRVMVRYPQCYFKASLAAADKLRIWVSDHEEDGFSIHPDFYQRGGELSEYVYEGAYEADLVPDAGGSHKLHSRSGVQPMTGGVIYEVGFDAGENEPSVGDSVDTPGGDEWVVLGYEVTSGTWAGNDAAGKVWIRKIGDDDPGWSNDETITNTTESNTLAVVDGAPSAIAMDIDDAEDWANEIGSGWGITNPHKLSLRKILQVIEWGSMDSQSEIGKGITDKASGDGFNGELTGHDDIDNQLDSQLTGTGTGTDGLTPVCWRGVENPWGNVWEFIVGINVTDTEYRIVDRDGLAAVTMDGTLGAGDYESSVATPLTDDDGYISDLELEDLLRIHFLASVTAGSSSTYIPDYCYSHDAGETNIALAGGYWYIGGQAGAGYLLLSNVASYSYHSIGARLEFKPQS